MSLDVEIRLKIDEICTRFEQEWSPDDRPEFSAYLHGVDADYRDQLLLDLLEVDVELRQKSEQAVEPEDYRSLGEEAVTAVCSILESRKLGAPRPGRKSTVADSVDSGSLPQVGPYHAVEKLGEGGMGSVWLAEQTEPVRRRVALKIIKVGLDSEEIITRFEAERQALSMMDHPNIAKVLDVGVTAEGRPYFAMELLENGVPLTKYCDANRLTLNQRLQLFIPICQAIQHAHQKGIIHRDIKPSNILVTEYDGAAVPKVIDFGLAKALQQETRLTDKTLFTEFGQLIGTLQYMSPEQAQLNPTDVDTRSDIYSLGVILYELLTGRTPLDAETIKGQSLLQLLDLIQTQDPPRPSARITSTGEAIKEIADKRQIEPSKLQQILRGDLDWVVMQAIEIDRTRRYESVSGLAADIERFLNGEPVQARPPSLTYKAGKLLRKHRLAFAASVIVFLAIVGGLIGLAVGMRSASISQKKAEKSELAARSAVNDYFVIVSENRLLNEPGLKELRKELLGRALSYYQSFVDENAGDQRDLANAFLNLAVIKYELADKSEAFENINSAIELLENSSVQHPNERLVSAYQIRGRWLRMDSQFAAAEKDLDRAVAGFRELWQRNQSPELLQQLAFAIGARAILYDYTNQARKKEEELENALKLLVSAPPNIKDDPQVQSQLANIYTLKAESTKPAGSKRLLGKACDIYQRLIDDNPGVPVYTRPLAITKSKLGYVYRSQFQYADSAREYREAGDLLDVLHLRNPDVPDYLFRLASARDQQAFAVSQIVPRDLDGAKELYEIALDHANTLLEIQDSTLWADVTRLKGQIQNGIAMVLRDKGDIDAAVIFFENAETTQRLLNEKLPGNFLYKMDLGGTLFNFGLALHYFKRDSEAVKYLNKAIEHFQSMIHDASHPFPQERLALSYIVLGGIQRQATGDLDLAVENYRAANKRLDTLIEQHPENGRYKSFRFDGELGLAKTNILVFLEKGREKSAIGEFIELVETIRSRENYLNGNPKEYWNLILTASPIVNQVKDAELKARLHEVVSDLLVEADKSGLFNDPKIGKALVAEMSLGAIRDLPEFQRISGEIEKRAKDN